MHTPINNNGLRRVAKLYLERFRPLSRQEALDLLTATLGAYDHKGNQLARGVEDYFGNDPVC